MSEYQYYEFQAVDRPLTGEEMRELRSYSTRARITPTSFVNEYHWGDFKGNPDAWMERYFDAYLYLANWGTHAFMLRLPSRLLDAKTAREYCGGECASTRVKSGHVILSFESEDDNGDDLLEGDGVLSSLISVRAELARGDRRALYLGWLLLAQVGEFDDDEVEPPVPPGLGAVSASLRSMAGFLRIDGDLLHVAAQASPPMEGAGIDHDEVQAWVGALATDEKESLITNLLVDGGHIPILELHQRLLKERPAGDVRPAAAGRTVGELFRAADARAKERGRIEAENRAREQARREREAAIAREKHLDSLAGREPKLWAEVERLIVTKQPARYDQAVKRLVDLRDLDARAKGGEFVRRIAALREAHARKPSLLERLAKAAL